MGITKERLMTGMTSHYHVKKVKLDKKSIVMDANNARTMILLSEEDILQCITMSELVSINRNAFLSLQNNQTLTPARMFIESPNNKGLLSK